MNGTEAVRRQSAVYAIRNLLDVAPSIIQLVNSPKIRALVIALLDEKAIAVRATLFDKTRDANWLVPWYQDLTICVKERLEVPGFGPWTVKAGCITFSLQSSFSRECLQFVFTSTLVRNTTDRCACFLLEDWIQKGSKKHKQPAIR